MTALHPVMTGARRTRIAATVLALAVLAAGAQAATTAGPVKGPVLVLRGPQKADKPATAPAAAPASPAIDPGIGPPPLADLSPGSRFDDQPAPRFSVDPAPRVGGLDRGGGGGACRTACAQTRYICRAGDEPDQCDVAWGQCVASCAESSSAPL